MRQKQPRPDHSEATDRVRIEAAALAALARRDHSAAEIRDKLVRRGFDRDAVDEVVQDLGASGLQDDARFVEAFVAARVGRGQGPVRIAQDLRQRGIAADDAEQALMSIENWEARAADVRQRKFGAAPPADWNERGKQVRFLQQRGFKSEHIRAALDGGWDEEA